VTFGWDNSFFARLLAPIKSRFRAILKSTEGMYTEDDLTNEAWLAAQDIQAESGQVFAPEDHGFQEAVLRRLWKAFGKYADSAMSFAFRLDKDKLNDDGDFSPSSLSARLSSPIQYQPLEALEQAEERAARAEILANRFTEAIAYLLTFAHFDNDKRRVAHHLSIPLRTLTIRVDHAAAMAELQPSIFDGIETIPRDFLPPAGRPRCPAPEVTAAWVRICAPVPARQRHIFSLRARTFTIG
jgi:hypothetical protein